MCRLLIGNVLESFFEVIVQTMETIENAERLR